MLTFFSQSVVCVGVLLVSLWKAIIVRRLRAFSMPKSPEWTRSKDTGLPWQNPPNAPIFVNIWAAAVWYIIKKASANFGKSTGEIFCRLYIVKFFSM